jgi:hypothetical protein
MENRALLAHQAQEVLLKLESAGLNGKLARMIIESKDNGIAKSMIAAIIEKQAEDNPRFELIKEFKMRVPSTYDHASQLDTFCEAHIGEFFHYDSDITDAHFMCASRKLIPGKTYIVKIFDLKEMMSSLECLAFLALYNAVLAGAQGIALVYQEKKDELPVGKMTISLDEEDALWTDPDGHRRVPRMYHLFGDRYMFGLNHFEDSWGGNCCLLCLCDPR